MRKKLATKISQSIRFTIVAIILIAIFCFALTPVTFQNDTYYTIKVGEHITQNGIDGQDPFSWHEDLGYTYPHWGYDLITYFIYQEFGFTGIYLVTCLLSITLGISIYWINTKLAKNKIISFFITIGVMYLIRGYIAARAQLVTFILFIFTIYFIEKWLKTKKKRYAIGLIAIPIAIANLHVAVFPFYFILYLPYIAEYLITSLGEFIIYKKMKKWRLNQKISYYSKQVGQEEKIQKLKREQKELEDKIDKIKIKRAKELQNPYRIKLTKNPNVKWLILIMIICLFTGLLTPLGTTPYTYLSKTMQGNTTQNINEHLPMTLVEETETMCTLILFLSVLIFTKAKIRLSDLFMLGGLCYLMLSSRRQVTMFAIIGSVILNRLMTQLREIYLEHKETVKLRKIFNGIGVMLIIIIVVGLSYHLGEHKIYDKYVDETTYPVQASNFIIENIDLTTARFYNEYNYGSYLLYRGIPVFIDSRADLYAPEFSGKEEDIFSDFIDTSSIGKFYGETFKKYNMTHIITYKNSKMNMIISQTDHAHYKELYQDNYFIIYEILP